MSQRPPAPCPVPEEPQGLALRVFVWRIGKTSQQIGPHREREEDEGRDKETRDGVIEKGRKREKWARRGAQVGQERPTCPRSYHSFPKKRKREREILEGKKEGQREVMSRRGQTSQKLSLISVVLLCPDGLPWRGSDGYCWCQTG